ncbi:hypothetical protein GCM10007207_17680 [Asaia siamensis]|uniref:Uncharacterized protein n=2 Tax=Asaia siamensis TaxID=110479 RepID=A0ABQ1M772_9PROT|nr:hypothetical protein AA0323_2705 [Asaia siamensis NRIC 0323]GGC32653.1 hypothetical protein GCM10007207_17680 [Asaia siamensis]
MNFQLYSQKDNGNWGQIECRDFYKKKDGTWSSKRPVKILSEKTLVVKYNGDNITFSGKKIENEINKICKR